jgi:RNA polymerase sigma-70 factor, ECF subfamily
MPDAEADTPALLDRARAGDPRAFDELAEAHRAELRAHCYRILGSVHDAEDALQDAMLRAWKGMSGFTGRGTVRAWLYSIATNAALDLAKHRSRRELPMEFGPPAGPGAEFEPNATEVPWLEPYPDQWLAPEAFGRAAAIAPEARYEQRESIELAFIVALQQLPPLQRAVLLLREVVGFSTAEIASQLDTSPQSVNSALQRARACVREQKPQLSQQAALSQFGEQRTAAIARQYADAIERADVDTIISMLTQDASWSMPPVPTWFRGHKAVRDFLVRFPLRETWRHRTTSANGQLAVGGYLFDADRQEFVPWVIDVLTFEGEKISAVTAFFTAEGLGPTGHGSRPYDGAPGSRWVPGVDYFPRFGLPPTVT